MQQNDDDDDDDRNNNNNANNIVVFNGLSKNQHQSNLSDQSQQEKTA